VDFSASFQNIIDSKYNRFSESVEIPAILNTIKPLKKHGGSKSKTPFASFFDKLCFGLSDCWYFRGSRNKHGYGAIKNKKAHRVSYELFFGLIPHGKMVLHKCDVRNCVNPDHLFLGTQDDNMKDAKAKGRLRPNSMCGEDHPMAKLNLVKIKEMISLRSETNTSYKEIGKQFNISTMSAYRAIKGISWKK